ncbi:MAG: ATP-binding protein [Peptostreptococcaceae bacterium]
MINIELQNLYLLITLIAIIVAILSMRYALNIRSYLREFANISQKVSKKEFHARLDITTKGELGELSRNFNEMIEIMHNTITELESSSLKTESILRSISHGILAIDINSNIILINSNAKSMLQCKRFIRLEGKSINTIIGQTEILKTITPFIASKKSVVKEIRTKDDQVYNLYIDPIFLHEANEKIIIGSIINIKNITKRVMLENMRSDFVANVSHELKTPVTSISGFVETLRINEDIDKDTRNRFLDIINIESERLKRLIDDILLLSFIENKNEIDKEEINVHTVFKEVFEITNVLAKNKNIEMHYETNSDEMMMNANRDYIKQIFINIIENAIKYSANDTEINVNLQLKKNSISFVVSDEGIGISKEDIDRIFERFYRVDKARSKEIGGTGLGLAITKHIIKNLGGSIRVESELGVGSKFIVSIPKNKKR